MPEIKTEIIDTNIKFNKNEEKAIVSQISGDWKRWDDDRSAQIDIIDKLEDLLDVETTAVESEYELIDQDGKTEKKAINKIKDADILQLYNSAVAHTYNSMFKTPSQMIDIQLENELNDSEKMQMAYLQKAALLDVWKKARAKKTCRKAVENWYKKGEIILYINWSQVFQNVRRKNPVAKTINVLGKPFGVQVKEWQVLRQLKYDGAKIKCIEPENFVIDTTRIGEEGCPWIFRDYATYQDIKDNEEYKEYLDSEALKELKNMVENAKKNLNNVDDDEETAKDNAVKDDQIEILTFNGDITVKNTNKSKDYRNLRIVVIGRKYIGCFKYNPDIIDPIVYCAARIHKDTGRGVPALSFIIPLTEATEDVINTINNTIGLSVEKCYLAPKGCMEGKQKVTRNGVIEFNDKFDISKVIPLDFASGLPYAIQFLQYIEGKKEQGFGRYKYSTGDSPDHKQTATAAKITAAGQEATTAYENDIIADEVIIPTFEKLGEFMANFQDKPVQMKYKDNTGMEQVGVIDDTVRQGNYVYMIGDTSSNVEKKANAEQFLLGLKNISELATQQGKQLSLEEIINTFGAIYDIENPMKFIEEMPMAGGMNEPQGGTGMPSGLPNGADASLAGMPPALPPANIQ